ncbi:MAG TPA: tRNA pseudouridine(55) synthase TruB [Gemmataceae bacterium]|nr:tRNA pseudouridine(55) synthase TruB [Gemmataceae bacterium]
MNASPLDGLLVLDKPGGVTSRDAVDRALRWFPRRTRIGHTGTLDPLATGVLVLCLGAATRLAEYVQRMAKTYRAGLRLGARSDTDDADGTVTPVASATPPAAAEVAAALSSFVGAIDQTPPAYSAAKTAGRRAYDLARQGQEVDLRPRKVQIYCIYVLNCDYPRLELEVRCGKGTYIRSLARDLGERLGCGALVQTLRRTRVGPFAVEDAVPLDADATAARSRLRPMEEAVAELPRVKLADGEIRRLCQGQAISLAQGAGSGGEAAVFDEAGRLAATAAWDAERRVLRPDKVLRAV